MYVQIQRHAQGWGDRVMKRARQRERERKKDK